MAGVLDGKVVAVTAPGAESGVKSRCSAPAKVRR